MATGYKGITVSFVADITDVGRKIRLIDQQAKDLEKTLVQTNKALKLDPKDAEVVATKMRTIAEETQLLTQKMEHLKHIREEMLAKDTKVMDVQELEKYKAGLTRVETEIAKTTTALKTLGKEQDAALQSRAAIIKGNLEAQKKKEQELANEQRKRIELVASIQEAEERADQKRHAQKLARIEAEKAAQISAIQEANAQITRGMSQINSVTRQLTRYVTLAETALIRLGAKAVKVGSEFDQSMSQVAATLNIEQVINQQTSAFARLRNQALELGKSTTFTASEASMALNELALGGLGVEKSMKALPSVLTLAKAGSMDLKDAANLVVSSISALNISVTDMDVLIDQMARTAQKSKVTVDQVGSTIQKTASAFNLAGQDTATMNAIIGTLGNRFADVSEQANTLRTALNRISTYAADFKKLGVEVEDDTGHVRNFIDIFSDLRVALEDMTSVEKTSILTKLFGQRGYSYAAYLMNATTGELQNLRREIENSDGAAKQMADTMTDNLASDLTITKSALQDVAIQLTDRVKPAFRDAASNATSMFNALSEDIQTGSLGKELEDLSEDISALIVNAIRKLIEYMPKIIEFTDFIVNNLGRILKLFTTLKVSSWAGTFVAGIGNITAGAVKLRTTLSEIGTFGGQISTAFKTEGAVASLANVATAATSAAAIVGTLVASLFDAQAAAIDVTDSLYDDKRAKEYLETITDFRQALRENREAREEDIAAIQEQREEYKAMADRIKELADAEELDVSGKNELLSLVYQLNTAIPGLNLQFDDTTNSLNLQNKELKQLIDNYANVQELAVLESYSAELATQKVKLGIKSEITQEDVDDALEKFEKAQYELYKAISEYKGDAFSGPFKDIDEYELEGVYNELTKNARWWGTRSQIETTESWEDLYETFKKTQGVYHELRDENTKLAITSENVERQQAKVSKRQEELNKSIDEGAKNNAKLSEELQTQHDIAVSYLEAEDDQSDALAKLLEQYPELIDVLQGEGYALDDIIKKTDDNTDSQETLAQKLETLKKATSGYKSELKDLLSTLDAVQKGTAYTTSQILDLIEKYPELTEAIHETADGYKIETEAVEALTRAKASELVASTQAQIAMLEAEMAAKTGISAYEIDAEGAIQERQALERQIAAYRKIADDISNGRIYTGASSSDTSTSYDTGSNYDYDEDTYDDYVKEQKERAKAEQNELENKYKLELISAEDYYNGLMDIAERYYADIGDLREEYLNAEEKVYEGLKKAQETELSTAKKLEEQLKDVKDAEDALKNAQNQQVQVYSGAAGFRTEQNTAAIEKAQQSLADKNYSLAETLLKNARFDGRSLTDRLQSIGLAQIRDMLPDLSGITLPSIGGGTTTQTTTSTRSVTYNGGDINITIQGSVDETTMPTLKTSIEDAVRKGIEAFLDEENAASQTGGI